MTEAASGNLLSSTALLVPPLSRSLFFLLFFLLFFFLFYFFHFHSLPFLRHHRRLHHPGQVRCEVVGHRQRLLQENPHGKFFVLLYAYHYKHLIMPSSPPCSLHSPVVYRAQSALYIFNVICLLLRFTLFSPSYVTLWKRHFDCLLLIASPPNNTWFSLACRAARSGRGACMKSSSPRCPSWVRLFVILTSLNTSMDIFVFLLLSSYIEFFCFCFLKALIR